MKGNTWGLSRQIFASVWLMCWGLLTVTNVTAAPVSGVTNQVQDIEFRRDSKGRGVVTIKLQQPQSLVDFRRQGKQLQLDIFDTQLTNEQVHTLDVVDFSTVVNSIDTSNVASGARFMFKLSGDYDYDYRIRGNNLEVTLIKRVQPKATSATNKSNVSYKGKPISINFQDIPVRNVLQLIADYNDFNLVVADTVSGNVTLRLDNVPWPQVLDIILQAKGLDKRVRGSVLLVAPKAELAANEHQVMETARKQQELASLRSELIQINYAKATDISTLLSGSTDGVGMLSERGSLHVDERTNALIIKDTPDNIASIKDIVLALDIPVKQVQIEARIVTIDEGNIDELGVRWGVSSIDGDTTIGGSIEGNLGSSGLLDDTSVDDFLNVNLGATQAGASSIAFQVAKLGNVLLDLELSALQSERKAEIISSPRLMTTNKKTAYIEQGTEIPYLEASSSGAVSVDFKKAVLSLMVTPQITPDNKLVLDLEVTQDSKGEEVPTGVGTAVAIKTQRIGTQVLVNNGETVVLGGIYQNQVNNTVRKVPILGDIPVLGALFRHKMEELGKRELLIFVTPKIVMQ
ncbi:type IV pilus secretin PilQ [Photobacterium phosphoreum]|jgi:type IV pilus assembly protein PilQ|uniref:Type IV pilus secretin PilQ n=1 Tax=Photobacterium phosphoreum TaxID=659 RepID=A0AAW4ZXK1_PHOPO|nr:type IV pilus secretin PilQ family protein [Photobacterium phosphoreum]MCD9463468.1 type IV pilus secretin PilQ [Photobacterium phosphoreum]MCD9471479.1 type IV pilus secretin PilQ [Photobacterium phosphoreum]MCD9476038.1 type IV pilus secretin PilQ [Photobacterium phosphoreum]MCD9479789.1 type IV pilus secretin PilQ [Photobacterium phosphoreum]MCD9483818.1 type IV pilus secretin PilQ [Photobacterium phosphoreum]